MIYPQYNKTGAAPGGNTCFFNLYINYCFVLYFVLSFFILPFIL